MEKINREIIFLRTFAFSLSAFVAFLSLTAFNGSNKRFGTIEAERIKIIERDGTVRMLITNKNHFPSLGDTINNRGYHEREKRAGMLFFNNDGIECGGFIFDGEKSANGHSSGLSLTFDQYDGDQVMQLITLDQKVGSERFKKGGLIFNDRPDNETQQESIRIMEELKGIKDPQIRQEKYQEYVEDGKIGGVPRLYLGKSDEQANGLFLFDTEGKPRAKFYINQANEVKLEVIDDSGKVVNSWPN